jgi:glutamate/tyrosine decarboxylase-like PLP-dependent enzyme
MLAAAMNSNCGGRDHGAVYVERCVIDWCKQMVGYPETASGLLLSGTSMGTLPGLAVARDARAGWDVRRQGLASGGVKLTAYISNEGHYSAAKAVDILGLGSEFLRKIPVHSQFRIEVSSLKEGIARDRANGFLPFCVVGTAGTVNTGAIDDLCALGDLCRAEGLWFHVDGAFGALCALDDRLRPFVAGMEAADSIAFDFHKWMHVPYDTGCLLVRNAEDHWRAFSTRPAYLQEFDRGLAARSRSERMPRPGAAHRFHPAALAGSRALGAATVMYSPSESGDSSSHAAPRRHLRA